MKKYILSTLSLFGLGFLLAPSAQAVCPVCTVAVVSGLGFTRWLGIDDSISGLWIGGLTVSMIFWTIDFCNRKKFTFKFRDATIFIAFYLLIVLPLHFYKLISGSWNIFSPSADKLLLGLYFGSAAFWAGVELYEFVKRKNGGKAHFPFEKVVFPIVPLIVASILFYFISK